MLCLDRTGIFLMAFFALALITRAVFNYTTGKNLEKFLEQRKSEGVPISVRDIERECSPRDNATLDWKIAEGTFSIEKKHRPILGKAIDDIFSGKPIKKETKDQIRDLITKNKKSLGFILDASAKPCFKFEEQWDILEADLKVTTAIQMILATRLLGIEAVRKAEDGNVGEAVDQCLAVRRFLELYLQEPFLINYLIGMACTKQIAVCLNAVVSDREVETEILNKILDVWDSSPWKGGLVCALDTERLFQKEASLLYLKGEYELELDRAGDMYYWIFRPVLKNEIMWMNQIYDRLMDVEKKPYYVS
jgi:hypothetical protein